MRFGIREICNVVFRAKAKQTLGSRTFFKDEPVLYFDTLKTSGLEGAATSVYAQGGRGNPRLVVWEGERTVTFTMEDALISKEGLAILTGAGLIAAKDANSGRGMFAHVSDTIEILEDNKIEIKDDFACWTLDGDGNPKATGTVKDGEEIKDYAHNSAEIFIMETDNTGDIIAEPCIPAAVEYKMDTDALTGKNKPHTTVTCYGHEGILKAGTVVVIDYYVRRTSGATQIEITADKFGGAYYIEADTLFRREGDNVDMPANFIIPNGKVQSNFNFAMAATGDPSTFTFTVDALPDYTKFDRTHKVLVAIQMIEEETEEDEGKREPCTPGENTETFKQTVTPKAAGVTATIDSDSATACTISVSGTDVAQNQLAADPDMWGNSPPAKAVAVEVNMPVDGAGEYKLVTTNPALIHYISDPRVEMKNGTYVKTQTIRLTDDDTLEMQILVGDDTSKDITVELSKDGAPVKTYTVKNSLTFATA